MRNVKCKKCKWVHFEVDRAHIASWKKTWDDYWPTLDKEGRDNFGLPDGPPTDRQYMHCFLCDGPYTNFEDAKEGDCPLGSTIQPILTRDE